MVLILNLRFDPFTLVLAVCSKKKNRKVKHLQIRISLFQALESNAFLK